MSNELTPIAAIRSTLEKMNKDLHDALPPQIPVEKFIRTTMTAIQMNHELLQADRKSLLASTMRAAQDGLLCDNREAALVIFRTKEGPRVQYMPMVGGILKKIRNSGELASISAQVVYQADQFDYELGDNERIVHKPQLGERGNPVAVYAIARTKDGAVYREVMSVTDVEKVRSKSKAANAGPWSDWWDEMAKKTVIRRLAKRLPSSADLDQVLEHDNEVAGFTQDERKEPINITPQEAQAAPLSRLKQSMKGKVAEASTEAPEQAEIVEVVDAAHT